MEGLDPCWINDLTAWPQYLLHSQQPSPSVPCATTLETTACSLGPASPLRDARARRRHACPKEASPLPRAPAQVPLGAALPLRTHASGSLPAAPWRRSCRGHETTSN